MESAAAWETLTQSSRTALRFAEAIASLRLDQPDSRGSELDTFDLLVGLVLSHPRDSEPRALLEHHGLTLADVLPDGYPRPSAQVLAPLVRPLDGQPPALAPDAAEALARAAPLGLEDGDRTIELRAVFGGLLQLTQAPAMLALGAALARVGADPAAIAQGYQGYLAAHRAADATARAGYARYLERTAPFEPHPVELPDYKADRGDTGSLASDLLDIRAEVDAFACLLASRGLRPPLAIGLFGDWGSGKTFFMNAVRDRIGRLARDPGSADRPQRELPFWKRIVQIDFNAWHYVEGELWASLVEHVFAQLSVDGDEPPSLVAQRREHWLRQIDARTAELRQLDDDQRETTASLEATRARVLELETERARAERQVRDLEAARTARAIVTRSADEVRAALAPLWLELGGHAADDALAALDEARAELRRSRAALRPFLARPRYALAGLAAIAAVPVATWLISLADVSAVVPVTSALAGAVAAAGGILRAGARWVAGATSRVEEARRSVEQEVADATSALDARIASEREAAAQAEAELALLAREQDRLVDELAGLRAELARTTPAQVLGEFVASRFGSDDYRKRLGVAATIRRDFDALSRLIAERNEAAVAPGASLADEGGDLAMNRIVLYIDDLDRCPAAKVVEVLQAVHLLLAFDLFVVVVAVDSRWLAEALLEHYPALVADGARRTQATPADYLEKIFQIPYWVRPLGDAQRASLIRGLLAGNVSAPTPPPDGQEHAAGEGAPRVGPEHDEVLATLFARDGGAPSLAAATLALAPDELAFLEALAPLLGSTPRAVKRFANLYQLVSALPAVRSAQRGAGAPSEQLAALLLALADGAPALARALFAGIVAGPPETTLGGLCTRAATLAPGPDATRLGTWLAARPSWRDGVTAGELAALLPTVTRFSFRFGATR